MILYPIPLVSILFLSTIYPVFGDALDQAQQEAINNALAATVQQTNSSTSPSNSSPAQVAQRADLIEKNFLELKSKNPDLPESDLYQAATEMANQTMSTGGPATIVVTERIPGANCTCIVPPYAPDDVSCGGPTVRKYSCVLEGGGIIGFQKIFQSIIKWFVYITMLLGVVAIIGAGILWAFGSESEEYTKKAKGWVMNIGIGLILLFTFRYILGFLAPWIFM